MKFALYQFIKQKKHMLQFNATIKIYYKNDFHKCNLFIFCPICFSYFYFSVVVFIDFKTAIIQIIVNDHLRHTE